MHETVMPEDYMPPMLEFRISETERRYVWHPRKMPRYLMQCMINYDFPLCREVAKDEELEQEMINDLFNATMANIRNSAWQLEMAQMSGGLNKIKFETLPFDRNKWPKEVRDVVKQLADIEKQISLPH
jgi:hypothetical protein